MKPNTQTDFPEMSSQSVASVSSHPAQLMSAISFDISVMARWRIYAEESTGKNVANCQIEVFASKAR